MDGPNSPPAFSLPRLLRFSSSSSESRPPVLPTSATHASPRARRASRGLALSTPRRTTASALPTGRGQSHSDAELIVQRVPSPRATVACTPVAAMTSTARAPALARADLPHRPTTPTSASSTTAALDALRPSPRTASVDRKRVRPEPPAVTPARRPSSPSPAPAPPPEPVRPTSPAPPKARREDWILPQIPPFRGGTTGALSAASASCAADAPPPPAAGPSAVPTSVAQADQAPRRVSYPLVFSLPRQNQRPATGPGRSESFSASTVTTGLGIAGVGVGAAGAREALVIERVGEASAVCARGAAGGGGGGGGRGGGGEAGASAEGGVRRGSLKRVLISDGEDELAAVRRRAAPASADERCVRSTSSITARETDRGPRFVRTGDPSVGQAPGLLSGQASSSAWLGWRTGRSLPCPRPSLVPWAAARSLGPSRCADALSDKRTTLLFPLAPRSMDDSSLPLPLRPAPSQHHPTPPPLVHRESAPSVTSSQRRRSGSTPPAHEDRGSPVVANKRRRTSPTPLDSLATTASDLLSSTPAPAPTPSTSTCAAPFTGVPLSTLVLGEPIQDQYQRELDRRRESAPAPLAGASTSRRASVAGLQQDITSTSGSSLGKRRGHRPPAVTTGPSVPTAPATHRASFSAVQGESASLAALRSAPVDIPSVLVGSPMEATFAARARERERERASSSSAARETAPAPRRQGQGAAVHPQPPLVSSSSYYIRPNQPLGPGHSFPPPPPPPQQSSTGATSPRSGGPPQEHARTVRLPSLTRSTGSSRGAPLPSFSSGPQGYQALHLLQSYPPPWAHGPHAPSVGPLSPLPPLSASVAAPGAPGASLPSPSFSSLPPHSAGLAPPPPSFHHQQPRPSSSHGGAPHPTHSAPAPPSKQAFLSLFSTFYDSLSDFRVLTASLDAQLGRAAQLLTTLQHAEAALDSALADVRREGDRRWAAVEHRLARLEGGTAAVGDGEARARDGGLEARLAKLERLLRDREEREDDTPRRPSGDSTSSGAVADSEASGAARDEDMEG